MINLRLICINKECTNPRRTGMQRCRSCIQKQKDDPSDINYSKVYERLADYIQENWSRGKVTNLSKEEKN